MKNVRKHRNIKLVTTASRRSYLVSEPNYHITKFFAEKLLATEMRKIEILMNTPVYLVLSVLDLSKTVINEFWYDYVKPKCGENAKFCYMDTDSFIVYVKTEDIYKDIAYVETRFDTSSLKIILKTQQRFRSKNHNAFTEKINKIALSSNDDKRMQSIDSMETHVHGTSKGLVCNKEE